VADGHLVTLPPCHLVIPSGLLVSVRSAEEAEDALAGGADLIDVKEPARGPLGRADDAVITAVVGRVAGRQPVSAALGELTAGASLPLVPGLQYVKWGLAGWRRTRDWWRALHRIAGAQTVGSPTVVTVAYADWRQAASPPVAEVCDFALARPGSTLLLDTFLKVPHPSGARLFHLLDCLSAGWIGELCARCRAAGVRVALAGALGPAEIEALLPARPDWFAVRGSVCDAGRAGTVSARRVRALADLLRSQRSEVRGRRHLPCLH
jgi:uncharacterized protein (UPF0264 family)